MLLSGTLQGKQISDQTLRDTHTSVSTQTQCHMICLYWLPPLVPLPGPFHGSFTSDRQSNARGSASQPLSQKQTLNPLVRDWTRDQTGPLGWGITLCGCRLPRGTLLCTGGDVSPLLVSSHILNVIQIAIEKLFLTPFMLMKNPLTTDGDRDEELIVLWSGLLNGTFKILTKHLWTVYFRLGMLIRYQLACRLKSTHRHTC